MTEIQASADKLPPPPPKRPWYFRNWAIALGILWGILPGLVLLAARPPRTRKKTGWSVGAIAVFLLLGLLPNSSSEEKSGSAKNDASTSSVNSGTASTVKKWDYRDHVRQGVTVTKVWDKSCARVKSQIQAKNAKYKSLLKTGNKYVTDSWSSSGLIDKVSWWGGSDSIANDGYVLVAKALRPAYMKAVDTTSAGAPADVPSGYVSGFIEHCKLQSAYSSLESSATSLQSLRMRVQSSASNVPWYPKGYTEYSTGLAWKWERASCSYGDNCWSMSVISMTGCSSLYAAITILDSADNNIGFSNDLTQGVRAGQRTLLRFEDFTPGADAARLSEISCY